ncbi:MAG TPA: NTP transferase domain-containing protein [Bacillota bacterium]
MTIGALVLAGRANTGALAAAADVPLEALVPVAGRPMIGYVLDALRASSAVGPIVVVGDPAVLESEVGGGGVEFLAPGATLIDNLRIGFAALASADRVLAVTSDIPLLTGEAIDDFIPRAEAAGGTFHYAIVERTVYEAAFPGSRRTWVRLRDGTFTGGNVFLADTSVAAGALDLVDRFYANRKNPLALARLLGLGTIFAYLLRRLTVARLERHVSGLVGSPGRALITPYAEIGFDVDRPDDLAAAEAWLRRRGQAGRA